MDLTLKTLADFPGQSGLSSEQWQRPAEFEDYGPTTVAGLAHYLCSHDQQHLAGLQWPLGQTHG